MSVPNERLRELVREMRNRQAEGYSSSWEEGYFDATEKWADKLQAALASQESGEAGLRRLIEDKIHEWETNADNENAASFAIRCGMERCAAELKLGLQRLTSQEPAAKRREPWESIDWERLPVKWRMVNGVRVDAETIAEWFFQVDDRRQRECQRLIEAACQIAALAGQASTVDGGSGTANEK